MPTQAKSHMRKRGRPVTKAKTLCVNLNLQQLKIVERAARQHKVTNPEALRRMAFIGIYREAAE